MTTAQSSDQLSTLKRAYLAIEKMEARLKAAEESNREPIAIIGVGCRFPGDANDPQAFWRLLHDGIDTITDVPASRWDVESYYSPDENIPGKMSTRQGGFLSNIDLFDPQFFGIAPREAISMDPQQRLLLEVAWEALENAGQAPDKLSGSRTGVFIGIINNDYRQLELQVSGLQDIDSYYSSGIAPSMASGRLSYVLGLQGPSISVDTACSSSLVSVHLACQSLRSRESNMALAGGVNLILTPELSVAFSKYQMLARDGRCKTFDASADGFGRGEGCGLIILKRLSDAVANGDNILALILGTAVNQDGPSSGLTAPNGPAQESVIRDALVNAGLKPSDITYIEAHGTGTSLGDPIELQALGSVFRGRNVDQPLIVGSVKTNVGHLEGSAGIAGLIKTALSLQNRTIPAHLHFSEPNPLIPWAELPIMIPAKTTSWPTDAPLAAGVSAFGFSGTNAHIILGAAPQSERKDARIERSGYILKLSTKSENNLKELAEHFNQHLATVTDADLADVCFSANVGRADLSHRFVITASSKEDMLKGLSDFVSPHDTKTHADGISVGLIQGSDQPRIGFLFTGQGSQYPGMGKQLFETQPSFRQTVEKCAEILQPYLRRSLLDVLFTDDESSALIHETEYTQPALFVLEYALAELWRSWGIRPSIVMGHSIGEYVAACVAGIFSLEDGLKLVAARGRLMQALPAGGQMATIFTDQEHVMEALKPYAGQISIAAVNGPQHIVISGEGAAIQAVLANLANAGIKSRKLTVSHAFHSPLMEPILSDFEKIASEVTYSTPKIKIVSNVSGQLAMGTTLVQAAYWRDHVRQTVQFETSMKTMRSQGLKLFLEIGPNPVLLELGQRCLSENEEPLTWLPSLRRGRGDAQMMLQSLGEMYT
ncbi:MAG: type I polyketide synthase, partial [Anaerolineales bacterium]